MNLDPRFIEDCIKVGIPIPPESLGIFYFNLWKLGVARGNLEAARVTKSDFSNTDAYIRHYNIPEYKYYISGKVMLDGQQYEHAFLNKDSTGWTTDITDGREFNTHGEALELLKFCEMNPDPAITELHIFKIRD